MYLESSSKEIVRRGIVDQLKIRVCLCLSAATSKALSAKAGGSSLTCSLSHIR